MTTRPPTAMRQTVIERAENCCEYCLMHQDFVAATHQIDHVVAEKHGGATNLDNLALSCATCNLRKASDVASFDPDTGDLIALFNPRTQDWHDHFELIGAEVCGKTPEGRTTVEFLRLNSFERMQERAEFIEANRYPPR